MARLSKEEWQVARERWEGSYISHEALALEIGVSQQAVSGQAKRNNWVHNNVVNDIVESVVDVVATKSKNNETTVECGIDDVVENVVAAETKAETKEGRGGVRENSGRPSSAQTILNQTIKERAAIHGDSAIETMVELMNNDEIPANVRLAAAEKLLDRGFGKPKQEVEMTGEVSYVDKTDLDDRYAKNMSKTAELAIKTQERIELLKQGVLH